MTTAISIEQVKKFYGKTEALKGIDLKIHNGEFFGLLGPNGAGKTTLISCMVGLAKPSKGDVLILDKSVMQNPLEAKLQIGFSPQEVNIERFFNIRRILEFQGGFYGRTRPEAKQRAEEMLQQFGLEEKAKMQFYKLSGGMQKRLLVARALMSRPKILILDEPTAGVDVEQRHVLWKYLRNLNRDGTTIILTTHYIDEAEALCERVGIINHGRIMELGSPESLIEKYCQSQLCLKVSDPLSAKDFQDFPEVEVKENFILVRATRIGPLLEKLIKRVLAQPDRRILDIKVQSGSLEEVFLKVTGQSLQAEMQGENSTEENPSKNLLSESS